MGIGGTSTNSQTISPNTVYSPTSYGGGHIVAGNVGNGPIGLSGQSMAEGGQFAMDLSIPMMPLQNLDFWRDLGKGMKHAAKIGAKGYKIGKELAPEAGKAWNAIDSNSYNKFAVPGTNAFLEAKEMGKSMGGWGAVDAMGNEL